MHWLMLILRLLLGPIRPERCSALGTDSPRRRRLAAGRMRILGLSFLEQRGDPPRHPWSGRLARQRGRSIGSAGQPRCAAALRCALFLRPRLCLALVPPVMASASRSRPAGFAAALLRR
jgi:hypothetical protein